jgi:hypothetical protein
VVSVTPCPRFSPGKRIPGTRCTGSWVGPRGGLDTEARAKSLAFAGDRTSITLNLTIMAITSCIRNLFEKLVVAQLVKKFLALITTIIIRNKMLKNIWKQYQNNIQ